MNEIERDAGLPATAGYHYAKKINNQLYIAGQVPHDELGRLIGKGDISKQAFQCLINLDLLLKTHQFDREDIQQLTIYVVGTSSDLSSAWSAIEDAFTMGVPPATLLGVASLGYDEQLVEIDATIIRET